MYEGAFQTSLIYLISDVNQIPVNSQQSTIPTTKKSKTSSGVYKVSTTSKLRSSNWRHWF